jgi:hypothetical protein
VCLRGHGAQNAILYDSPLSAAQRSISYAELLGRGEDAGGSARGPRRRQGRPRRPRVVIVNIAENDENVADALSDVARQLGWNGVRSEIRTIAANGAAVPDLLTSAGQGGLGSFTAYDNRFPVSLFCWARLAVSRSREHM